MSAPSTSESVSASTSKSSSTSSTSSKPSTTSSRHPHPFETLCFDNRALRSLPIDPELRNFIRRNVPNSCFSLVQPEPVARPKLIALSGPALGLLGLGDSETVRVLYGHSDGLPSPNGPNLVPMPHRHKEQGSEGDEEDIDEESQKDKTTDAQDSQETAELGELSNHPLLSNLVRGGRGSAKTLVKLATAQGSPNLTSDYLSGNKRIPGAQYAAATYCGHQFGSFAGQLGDGAAMYIGEVIGNDYTPTDSTSDSSKPSEGTSTTKQHPDSSSTSPTPIHHVPRIEFQFKGSGPTPYSRDADGRKVLRSSLREFLASEAMHHLRIPSTRSASIVTSDSAVMRDPLYSGEPVFERCTIITRLSRTFLRLGSFELFNPRNPFTGRSGPSFGNGAMCVTMLNYAISTLYPHLWVSPPSTPPSTTTSSSQHSPSDADLYIKPSVLATFPPFTDVSSSTSSSTPPRPVSLEYLRSIYRSFVRCVITRTAHLVAKWQGVGFVHGVLNTDNISIIGVTIDYGPYAFMDGFDTNHISNGSDHDGRYRYKYQPSVCLWNLLRFAEALSYPPFPSDYITTDPTEYEKYYAAQGQKGDERMGDQEKEKSHGPAAGAPAKQDDDDETSTDEEGETGQQKKGSTKETKITTAQKKALLSSILPLDKPSVEKQWTGDYFDAFVDVWQRKLGITATIGEKMEISDVKDGRTDATNDQQSQQQQQHKKDKEKETGEHHSSTHAGKERVSRLVSSLLHCLETTYADMTLTLRQLVNVRSALHTKLLAQAENDATTAGTNGNKESDEMKDPVLEKILAYCSSLDQYQSRLERIKPQESEKSLHLKLGQFRALQMRMPHLKDVIANELEDVQQTLAVWGEIGTMKKFATDAEKKANDREVWGNWLKEYRQWLDWEESALLSEGRTHWPEFDDDVALAEGLQRVSLSDKKEGETEGEREGDKVSERSDEIKGNMEDNITPDDSTKQSYRYNFNPSERIDPISGDEQRRLAREDPTELRLALKPIAQRRVRLMCANNPKYILRNHIAEEAIRASNEGDYITPRALLRVLEDPYDLRSGQSGKEVLTPVRKEEEEAVEAKAQAIREKLHRLPPVWARTLCVTCSS